MMQKMKEIRQEILTGERALFNGSHLRIYAVSYTHLDVYKRQVLENL